MTEARSESDIFPSGLPPDRGQHGALRGEKLAENIAHFVRLLRRTGMRVGPATLLDCVDAAAEINLGDQREFYHALASCVIKRPEDRLVFDQAFALFWRNPDLISKMREMMLPTLGSQAAPKPDEEGSLRRLEEAMQPDDPPQKDREDENIHEEKSAEIDAALVSSDDEKLKSMDFQMMSAAEIAEAERAIDRLVLPVPSRPSRRFSRTNAGGRLSFKRTLRQMARHGGLALPITEARQHQPRPVIVICDISGSMEHYSRILLRFTHVLTQRRARVHSFLFGTRLTNITRQMQGCDPDAALASIATFVQDWSGGTRLTSAISIFNKEWSRRVLGQGAVVLLITDGLDRDSDGALAAQMERLQKSCAKLIWLNPLLRFDGFEPRSTGIQQMLPHVDSFVPVHSLNSITQLAELLTSDLKSGWRDSSLAQWMQQLHDIQNEPLKKTGLAGRLGIADGLL
ncbi:MAG: VWA domain-containing protein [Bacteroidetes bacterium]|nr:VWA domain-containing protein [Bacteroidota bacterium]